MKFRQIEPKKNGAAKGNMFLKLGDKESVQGIFQGDPYEYEMHWVDGRGVVCEHNQCKHCANGERSSFRFKLNFIISENGQYTAKIFENGWLVYEAMRELHETGYNLEETLVRISRNGMGRDTTYSILPVPNGKLPAETLAKIKEIKLLDLQPRKTDVQEEVPF